MNETQFNRAERDALVATMAGQLVKLQEKTRSSWTFDSNGRTVSVSADAGWFRLQSAQRRRRNQELPGPRRAHALLASNACLPEGLTYAIGRHCQAVYLLADVPLHFYRGDLDALANEVELALESYQAALHEPPMRSAAELKKLRARQGEPLTVDDAAGEAARTLCQNAGWEYHERGSGQLAITLEVPNQLCQAQAFQAEDGRFRLSTILETPPQLSPDSRYATATFLLSASHVVRLARATAEPKDGAYEYGWEVTWDSVPTVPQFHCGMSALSIASRMTSRELRALSDDTIASAYMRLRAVGSQ